MGEFKKLFRVRRILAMALAVALAVTSAPMTAQAAPGENPEQIETNVDDNSIKEKEGESEGEPADEGVGEGVSQTTPEDTGTESPETPPSDPPADTPDDSGTVPADPEQGDEAKAQQPAADGAQDADTVTDAQTGEDSGDADAQDEAEGVRQAEIKFDELDYLQYNYDVEVDFDYENQSATITTAYSDENDNPFGDIVDSLKDNSYYVYLDGLDGADGYDAGVLRKQLKYTWQQKGGDGNYAPMAGVSAPVKTGEYRLEISIDQELVAAESKYIDFVIEKAKLYIKTDAGELPGSFAGMTVVEVREAYAKAMQIALGSEEGTVDDRYLQFVAPVDKDAVKVSNPLGDAALPDTDILKMGSDYLVEIAPALKAEYQADYELYTYAENIVITELIGVSLKTESSLEPGKDITYLYGEEVKSPVDTAAAADRKVAVRIIVDGVKDEATGEDKELPVVLEGEKQNVTGAWLDADKKELGDGKTPKDAGVYYYKLTYSDPDGIYGVDPEAGDCLVKVVVAPVMIAVRPTLADSQKEYNAGISVDELLKNVGYKLLEKDETGAYAKEYKIPSNQKDTFWGVSYNQPDKPQYYEPVFKVQKRVTKTTTYTDTAKKAETVEGNWEDVKVLDEASAETKVEAESNKDQTVTKKAEYRVVFAGQKGLYKNGVASGIVDINKQIDINSADKNYDVDVTKAVVEDAANTVAVTVNSSKEVTINTEEIVKNIKDMTLTDGVYTKEYNEKAPFDDRSKYKKAKADDAAADKAGSFTYEWYGFDLVEKVDDKGETVKDDAGNPVKEPVCDGIKVGTDNDYTLQTLANAGDYCLKISYTDPSKAYTAKPAYLFFTIEGKLLKVVPKSEQKPKAYIGGSIYEFTAGLEENGTVTYSIHDKDENGTDLTETLEKLDQEVNAADKNKHLYRLTWVVLQGDNMDPAKAKYTKASGTFKEGVPYKLGAELTFNYTSNENYKKYYLNYTNKYERPETDSIRHNYWYTPLDIELGKMSDVGLKVEFHPEKLASLEEVYDGNEHFKVEDLISAGYITAAAENNPDQALAIGNGEGQVPLVFKWQKYDVDEGEYVDLGEGIENPVNAGEYCLLVSYPGDDKYKDDAWQSDDFQINPRDLKIQVKAALDNDKITAGWDMSDNKVRESLVDKDGLTVTGYIEADKEAFAEGATAGTGLVKDAPAFTDSYRVVVWEKGNEYTYTEYLRFDKEYEAVIYAYLNAGVLKDKRAQNYNIIVESASFKVGRRGNSTVKDGVGSWSSNDVGDYGMHVRASAQDHKVTVTPVSGICYFYDNILGILEEMFVPGNYLIFDIVAPTEFDANGREHRGGYEDAFGNFVYKNSIEGTGKGFVLSEDAYNGTIRVAFPVTKEDQKTKRTFTILWEKLNGVNYTEEYTVDMTGAQLEDDLRTAVAPKTLAFNGVNTKMTVGETQQLDVKMTKTLNSDVVFLNYEVAVGSEKLASVTRETGVVTALAKGKATINVYPVRRNNRGEVERIPEFKKTVRTTITISDVTAPKINSVYPYDHKFELKYTQPANGYRREIYVLEGKNKKAGDFETLIKKAQDDGGNRLDDIFVYAEYVTDESADPKTKAVTRTIYGIEPGSEYTVYVRNVSGVRTLDDGSFVVASAQGSVKSFKATKAQLLDIRLDYKTAEEQAKRTPAEEKIYSSGIDEIDLSKGSVQLKAMGKFKMQPGTPDAEDSEYAIDHEWKELPLNKKDPVYETQKLTFYAVESTNSYTKEQIAANKNWKKEYKTLIGDRYYKASSIAKIDKKGKLSLKGVGVVYIIAYDSVSRKITPVSSAYGDNTDTSLEVSKASSHYALRITSPITGIKTKAVTLKVGSYVSARPSLTFYNGTKKLTVSASQSIPLIVKSADDNKAVEIIGSDIIAKEPNQTVKLTVCLADDPTVKADLTVKTKPMDPVKSVKAVDVIDHEATITFTHTANKLTEKYAGDEYVKYKIELRDNRNRLIRSHMETGSYNKVKSDETKGIYFYECYIDGLKRQSVYNVTITPVYGEQTAKAAKGRFTTTNIPAYGNGSVGKDSNGNLMEGGMDIYITSVDGGSRRLENAGYLTSGNTYTLTAEADETAKDRKTDTLTWKSSNSKVASVKANAGSYTATLKAASVGSAYIEVTSKITKKVIARYIVRVKSVGNGGMGAYGDTEPKDNIAWDPDYDQGIEVLTEKNPVRFATPMGAYDYRWISFTAPADGRYSLGVSGATISEYYYKTDFPEVYDGGEKKNFNSGSSVTLDEGETIYFKAAGTSRNATAVVTVTSSQKYGKLTASGSVSVVGISEVSFIASEDNYYTFYASESGKQARYMVYNENGGNIKSGWVTFATAADAENTQGVGVKKGQRVRLYSMTSGDYTISVKGRTYAAFGTGTGSLVDDGKEGSVTGKWYAFEAKAAGEYTFTVSPDKANAMEAEYFADVTWSKDDYREETFTRETSAEGKETLSITKSLNEGDKIAVYVYATGTEAVSAEVSASQPKTAVVSLAANTGELTVEENKPVWVSFKVPESGKEYCFGYAAETGKSISRTYYKNDVYREEYFYQDRFKSTDADQTIYIKLETSDASAKVTVSVKETAATAVTPGQNAPFEVTSGNKQFFTFTAPTTGLYEFKAALKGESKDKNVSVQGAYSVSQNTGTYTLGQDGVRKLLAGETVIIAVSTWDSGVVKGDLKVTAVPFETLEAKEYTFAANETKRFKFTPSAAGKYIISYEPQGATLTLKWGSSMDYINSAWTGVLDVSAGDAVYVKAVNYDSTAESKVTFTITAADQPLPADGKISVKADSPVTYKYLVKQAGRYKVTYTADTEGAKPTVTYTKGRASIASGEEIVCPAKGETIEFSVSVEKDAVVTLTMTPIVPSTASEATVAKGGGVQWFVYTVPATGRYTAALTDQDGKAIAANISAQYVKDKITNENLRNLSGLNENWLSKDTTYYIRVQNNGTADQAVKLAVTQITASETLEVGAAPKSVSLNEGDEKWYNLELDEDAFYNITLKEAKLEFYQDGHDNGLEAYSSGTEELDKGKYLVKVTRNGGIAGEAAAAEIGIKKEKMETLNEGVDLELSFNENGTQYITFTPSKTAYYAFRLKDISEGVDYVDASVNVFTAGDDSERISLSADKRYGYLSSKLAMAKSNSIEVSLGFTPAAEGEKKIVKLYVEEIQPAELVSELSVTVEKGAKSWFAFTAPEAGYYSFAEDSSDVRVRYSKAYTYSYESDFQIPYDQTYGTDFPDERVYLEKDTKLTYSVWYNDLKPDSKAEKLPDSVTFKVTAAKFEPEELSLSTPKTITFAENETEKWYSVKAKNTNYSWKFAGTEGKIQVTIYNSTEGSTSLGTIDLAEESEREIYLSGSNDCLVRITSEDHPTFQMEVFWQPPVDVSLAQTISVGGTEYVSIADGEYALFVFKAPKAGMYTFYSGKTFEDDDPYGTLYDDSLNVLAKNDDGEHLSGFNFEIAKNLKKGQTVYLKVNGLSDGSLQNCKVYVIEGVLDTPETDE